MNRKLHIAMIKSTTLYYVFDVVKKNHRVFFNRSAGIVFFILANHIETIQKLIFFEHKIARSIKIGLFFVLLSYSPTLAWYNFRNMYVHI